MPPFQRLRREQTETFYASTFDRLNHERFRLLFHSCEHGRIAGFQPVPSGYKPVHRRGPSRPCSLVAVGSGIQHAEDNTRCDEFPRPCPTKLGGGGGNTKNEYVALEMSRQNLPIDASFGVFLSSFYSISSLSGKSVRKKTSSEGGTYKIPAAATAPVSSSSVMKLALNPYNSSTRPPRKLPTKSLGNRAPQAFGTVRQAV